MMHKEKRCITLEEENKQDIFDVIIVGAGPAGCASAILLAEQSLKVGLIDEVNPNKPKVGESIPAATKRLLQRLNIPSITTLLNADEYKPCASNASAWGTPHWHYQDALMNPEGSGWHIDRNAFDAALYQKATENGTIPIQNQVKNVIKNNSDYFITLKKTSTTAPQKLYAKWIIDATGRASKIGRSLGFEREEFSEQVAAIAWVKTAKDRDFSTRIKSVKNGWWYSALLPNQRRIIAFHGLREAVAKLIQEPSIFVESFNEANLIKSRINAEQILHKLQGRDASFGKLKTVAAHHFLAVGDAAISFDPLAAQGIFFALYSGIKAGEAILKSYADPSAEARNLDIYTKQVDDIFQYNHKNLKAHYHNELRFLKENYWRKMQG